jgi:hypothetical protein
MFSVQASGDENERIFGEALAFYQLKINDVVEKNVVVYHQLRDVKQTLGQLRGKWNRSTIHAIDIRAIVDIVGIWEPENDNRNVYVLRKHPAIALLSPKELGKDPEVAGSDELGPDIAGEGENV